MSISHFEQEAAHQQYSISEQDEFTAAKLFDGTFSTAVTDVLKGMNRQTQSNFELRPDGTILLGTVPFDQNSVSGVISGAAAGIGGALKNALQGTPKQADEDRNAMDKHCPPSDGIRKPLHTINEGPKFFDIKLEPPVKPADAPAPRPKSGGVGSVIGSAIAEGATAGAIGSVIRDGAVQPRPISGSFLQNLLQQNSSGGITSGLKEVLTRQNK